MVGKRTREAVYVHASAIMPPIFTAGGNLTRWYSDACEACDVCTEQGVGDVPMTRGGFPCLDDDWLVKFSRHHNTVSFLYYPNFRTDPHPELAHAVTVNLDKRTVKVRSYIGTDNRPILHRKEEFVAKNHPLRARFAAVTRQEEARGFYAKDTLHLIGTRKGWEKVQADHGTH